MNIGLIRCVDGVFPKSMIKSLSLITLLMYEVVEDPLL